MYDKPFLDDVNRASYHEMMPGSGKREGHRLLLAQYRQALRRATRFALDDDAVRLVCNMTKSAPDKLELWSILARLPYDTMWMEFDLWEKCREFERLKTLKQVFDPTQVSHRCGLLFQRDLDSETRWLCTEFVDGLDGVPVPQPVSMVFDPEGSTINPVAGATLWKSPTLSKVFSKAVPVDLMTEGGFKRVMADPEFGYLGITKAGIDDSGEFATLEVPDELANKIGAVVEPMWQEQFAARAGDDAAMQGKRSDMLLDCLMTDATERTGALKWYITALAMINDVPLKTRHVQPRSGKMLTKSGPTPFLDYSVITINVPKAMDIRYIGRRLTEAATEAHRKRHAVMGHWRIVEHGRSLQFLCKHQPTMVEDGLAICTRCERIIRWIRPHERGDSRLGYVDHGYVVKG